VWEYARRGLSHQSLKNSFLLRAELLSKAQRLGNRKIATEVSTELQAAWTELGSEIRSLVDRCESECSPRWVLERVLIQSGVSDADCKVMTHDLHEAWLVELGVTEWAVEVIRCLDVVNRLLAHPVLNGPELESACRNLCDLLHDHPLRNRPI
jgi:hypothetical protein